MKKSHLIKIFTLIFALSFNLSAKEHGVLRDAKVYAGIGPTFGSYSVGAFNLGVFQTLGNLQLGVDFLLLQDQDFSVHLGPLLSLAFGSGFFGADFDVASKASYRFNISEKDLIVYGKASLGLSTSNFGTGFNLGLTPGIEFYFTKQVGMMAELGFLHRSYFNKFNVHLPSGSFSLGVIYRF